MPDVVLGVGQSSLLIKVADIILLAYKKLAMFYYITIKLLTDDKIKDSTHWSCVKRQSK